MEKEIFEFRSSSNFMNKIKWLLKLSRHFKNDERNMSNQMSFACQKEKAITQSIFYLLEIY